MKIKRIEGRNVILNRTKAFLLAAWFVFTIFCVLESFSPKASGQQNQASYETQFLNNASDPSTPSPRYVLDKLNKHLSNSIADSDTSQLKAALLAAKVDDIVNQNLGTKVAVLSEKVETQGWILKAVLGGIATLLGKEILEMIRNKRNS